MVLKVKEIEETKIESFLKIENDDFSNLNLWCFGKWFREYSKPKFLRVVHFNCKSFKRCKWSKKSFVKATCSITPHNTHNLSRKGNHIANPYSYNKNDSIVYNYCNFNGYISHMWFIRRNSYYCVKLILLC